MQTTQPSQKETRLSDLLMVLLDYRWIILRNTLITCIAAILLTFVLPKKWTAETTLMPPEENSRPGMSSMMEGVDLPGFSFSKQTSSTDLLLELLKSRSLSSAILQRTFVSDNDTLPLYKIAGFSSVSVGTQKMYKIAEFMKSKQGIISIRVELGDPDLSARVANAFVEELDRFNQQKSVSRAKNSRLYIEEQLENTHEQLVSATKRLAEFQQKNRAVSLENQMQASFEQTGQLKAQIIAKEINISMMQEAMKPQNPQLIRAKQELKEMKKRYADLQIGSDSSHIDTTDIYVPFLDVPKIAIQIAELKRDVQVQETVWELLNRQYYQAKIEEARNTPTVQVLDPAVPPPFRSAPQRKLIVIALTLLGFVFSIFYAFADHTYNNLNEASEEKQKLQTVSRTLSGDAQRIRSKLKTLTRSRKRG
ncbi:MAG: Wzz/FepE/Etk N-terminal domain-containing protein [candidate division KSB1 bacterium]|nr:Wzz/FepE/Etk N-terminal domain-containing protein [candidate division KSB1 bacterium]